MQNNNNRKKTNSDDSLIAELPFFESPEIDFPNNSNAYLLEWSWAFEESVKSAELSQMLDTAIPVRLSGSWGDIKNIDPMEITGLILDEMPYSIAAEGVESDFAAYFLVPAGSQTSELITEIQGAAAETITDMSLDITIESIEQLKLTDFAVELTDIFGKRPHQLDILIAAVFAQHGWDIQKFADFTDTNRIKFWEQQYLSLGE
ncbi:MAG: hypothetical protein QM613_04920 [Micrococcaceae bacterium]